ncbi:MAG: phosphatidylserine decarboxylase [Blastomonas fulva]|jgi:phosphatidylserine decarboxylase|uniref:phosphatidylserine decarboxylase n=1 Tax=Blastomonas fulva TaxID=1550728 RepID=UPI0024E220B8|nr:phosphatidylserine decarboxylase [Blastomonas fulva]MDK2759052.1 phosphatidylserine decarboxylase [Blastomonas fulva]
MSQELLDNRGKGLASWSMPPVHPEGRKFAVAAAAMTLIFALLAWETLAWPMAGITLWILAFFRDPARVTPLDERLVVAPADGLCTMIELVPPPVELAGPEGLGTDPLYRVSIFMSVFDVHINRAPIGGTIRRIVYISGKFLNADLDKASDENERQHIMIERSDGARIGFTQIAGLVARRIVPFIKEGDFVAVGQRVGLIRFGSRVDVYLPQGTAPAVVKGQRIVAGETILAVIGETPVREGISH